MDVSNISEQVKCPVCYEIPKREILQCRNGHIVCRDCFNGLQHTECPQCRVPFGTEIIRARVLELLLDTLEFPCPNKALGCEATHKRSELPTHIQQCRFLNKSIRLCKAIGFHCQFPIDTFNVAAAQEHFLTIHKCISQSGSFVDILHENFKESVTANNDKGGLWRPILLKYKIGQNDHNVLTFLFLSVLNGEDQSVSWICIFLGSPNANPTEASKEASDFLVTFSIKNESDEDLELKWQLQPVSLIQAAKYVQVPPFRIPITLLVERCSSEGNLLVNIAVTDKVSGNHQQKPLTLTPTITSYMPRLLLADIADLLPVPLGGGGAQGGVIFPYVTCDSCSANPVTNIRYKCLQCEDYDLCGTCMAMNPHAATEHLFAAIETTEKNTLVSQSALLDDGNGWRIFFPDDGRSVVFHLDYLKVLLASGLQSLPSVLKCFRCDFVIVNAETFLSDAHICLECPSFVLLCDNCYQVPSHRLSHASHVFTRARSWEQCHYVRYQLMKRFPIFSIPNNE